MKSLKKLMLGVLLASSSFFVHAGDEISAKEAAALANEKKAIIVDVREQDEWNAGHIKNAIHIPLSEIDKHIDKLQPYKEQTIVTQCRSGKRSMQALELLKAMGYKQVYSMDGGIQAWQQQGLSLEK